MTHPIIKTDNYIYITSNEEIKEGTKPCWCIDTKDNSINYYQGALPLYNYIGYKKIILTTDQDLIKDGVQAIDDEFLEWFVNNPNCEKVETKLVEFEVDMGLGESCVEYGSYYKLIIPKEEPKQENCCTPIGQIKRYVDCKGCDRKPKQETLEEAAERMYPNRDDLALKRQFINGANWQQERMYSEEEVLEIVSNCDGSISQAKKWFEQFKKK